MDDPPPAPTLPARPEAPASKDAWRRWSRAARRALASDHRSRRVAAGIARWAPYRQARSVLLYLAFGSEVDLAPLVADASRRLLVPRTGDDPDALLELHDLAQASLEPTPFGPLQPAAGTPAVDPAEVDVVLVPGLCFDGRGVRLGYGRGHFDRFLATLPAGVPRVGVTFDALVVERLPLEPHDATMTHLATETGVVAVTEPRSAPATPPSR